MLPDKNFEKMNINKHAVIYPCMKFQSFFCRTSDYVTKLSQKIQVAKVFKNKH